MPLLLGLLVVEAMLLRGMVRSPFTPWLLLEWPMGVWITGLTYLAVEVFTTRATTIEGGR